jgi:hypothetical protein
LPDATKALFALGLPKGAEIGLSCTVMNHSLRTILWPPQALAGLMAAVALTSLVASAAETPAKPAAGAAKLPSAVDVVAKHLKAVGGRDTFLKHSSTLLKGTWDMPSQGATGAFELLQAKPNKRLMHMKLGETGEIVNGYDGKVGWVTSPFAPPALIEGKMLDQTRDDADYYGILHNPTNFQSMETVARTQFDNRECLELKLVAKSGRTSREFYDAKTGLLAGVRTTQETPQGPSELLVTFLEYRKFGDLMQAAKMKIGTEQGDLTIGITSVEYDVASDSQFEPPAENQGTAEETVTDSLSGTGTACRSRTTDGLR